VDEVVPRGRAVKVPHDARRGQRYDDTVTSNDFRQSTLTEIREFFSRTEAPWRVTIVIIATVVAVLIVAWDTARHAPKGPAFAPTSAAATSTTAAPSTPSASSPPAP
jgi:hypothetical protein